MKTVTPHLSIGWEARVPYALSYRCQGLLPIGEFHPTEASDQELIAHGMAAKDLEKLAPWIETKDLDDCILRPHQTRLDNFELPEQMEAFLELAGKTPSRTPTPEEFAAWGRKYGSLGLFRCEGNTETGGWKKAECLGMWRQYWLLLAVLRAAAQVVEAGTAYREYLDGLESICALREEKDGISCRPFTSVIIRTGALAKELRTNPSNGVELAEQVVHIAMADCLNTVTAAGHITFFVPLRERNVPVTAKKQYTSVLAPMLVSRTQAGAFVLKMMDLLLRMTTDGFGERTRRCTECGDLFVAKRVHRKTCSGTCRNNRMRRLRKENGQTPRD